MASFCDIMLRMAEEENPDDVRDAEQESEDSALMGAETDPSTATGESDPAKAPEAIRNGINLRPDFWDDFIKIVNDSVGLSALLGVEPDQVTQWGQKVDDALKKVKNQDTNQPDGERKNVIPTGNSIGGTE